MARKARSLGLPVVCVGIRGEASPELADVVQRFYWTGIGKMGWTLRCFKREGVRQIVMAGKVHKTAMNAPTRPAPTDIHTRRLAPSSLACWGARMSFMAVLRYS